MLGKAARPWRCACARVLGVCQCLCVRTWVCVSVLPGVCPTGVCAPGRREGCPGVGQGGAASWARALLGRSPRVLWWRLASWQTKVSNSRSQRAKLVKSPDVLLRPLRLPWGH